MLARRFRLFQILGFEVSLDPSWIILALLVSWTLAEGYFPLYYADLTTSTYWSMGVAGAIGLFLSIVFHELCHSVVARSYGIQMNGITLFIFGGVAEMNTEPPNPKSEFLMAVAGPISSYVLAAGFYLASTLAADMGFETPVIGVLAYLGFINLILATFNLVPAFPLDGGRMLRSALWAWKNDLRWATRISSTLGVGLGVALIVMGAINVISGNFIGGMWWFLIGLFVRGAAQSSYHQLLLRQMLTGERVQDYMTTRPVAVSPDITIRELVDDYFYRHHLKMLPVVENDELRGMISTQQIKGLPAEQWPDHRVRELMLDVAPETSVSPHADAIDAVATMNRTGNARLLVVDNGHLVGVISLKDILQVFALKVDLEGGG